MARFSDLSIDSQTTYQTIGVQALRPPVAPLASRCDPWAGPRPRANAPVRGRRPYARFTANPATLLRLVPGWHVFAISTTAYDRVGIARGEVGARRGRRAERSARGDIALSSPYVGSLAPASRDVA